MSDEYPGAAQPPPPETPAAAPETPAGAPQPGRSRRGAWGWIVLALGACALILLGEVAVISWAVAQIHPFQTAARAPGSVATVPQAGEPVLPTGQGLNLKAIASKVDPAVADINTTIATLGQPARASGTGMVLTSSGEVLTNNHVVQGSTSIEITIAGRPTSYTASVIGVSPSADVALLQIQGAHGLATVTLADSSSLKVGQPVAAIGNAFGQGGTPAVSQGTITALDRTITASSGGGRTERLTGLIESDAPISEGESGGPLVNAAGQVIGMITAGESQGPRQTTSTVGYAIPSSTALGVVNQIRSGRPSPNIILGLPGYLGVSVHNVDSATAAQLGLAGTAGALVAGVASGSPAAQAGIQQNAVITAIDGAAVASADALGPAIQSHKPGERIQVTWLDRSGTHTTTVTLATGPAA